MILADDLGIDSIGNRDYWPNGLNVITPNLDALAANGRVFSRARVNPKCSPTRAGVLSGRIGLRTGVIGYQIGNSEDKVRLALQSEETTIAEVLRSVGYQTFFVGKWHVGGYGGLGQNPEQQGFDIAEQYGQYLKLDDPIEVGDEHLTYMVNLSIDLVNGRVPQDPYTLFFWHLDPHSRIDDSGREPLQWWKVDESLLPSGEPYYHPDPRDDLEVDRYRAVVEAYDTELRRMLYEIGVVDINGVYRPESNTVVFFMGDNGEHERVSLWGRRSKGTVYECGVRVPCFVFGAGVPADGADSNRRISHLDLYNTICDIVGVPGGMRGDRPRDSISFADAIGWSDPLPRRRYQIMNQEDKKSNNNPYDQRVALVGPRYKLIARAGGAGLAPLNTDELYDLETDPHEKHDLIIEGMNANAYTEYLAMRDAIVDYWFTSVCEPTEQMVDVPMTHAMSLTNVNEVNDRKLPLGHAYPGEGSRAREARVFYRFDIAAIDDLLPQGKTLADVASAQVVVVFKSDSGRTDETDTDLIRAYPVTKNWYTKQRTWAELQDAYRPKTLGQVDFAPHIVWDPEDPRLSGVPMPPDTPVSLGHNETLLEAVMRWHDEPGGNHGIVLMARPDMNLSGDQHVTMQPAAFLRLTLRP